MTKDKALQRVIELIHAYDERLKFVEETMITTVECQKLLMDCISKMQAIDKRDESKYDYTPGEEDELRDKRMELEEDHDCHNSPMDGCDHPSHLIWEK